RATQTERPRIVDIHVAKHLSERARRLAAHRPWAPYLARIRREVTHDERLREHAAVRVRVRAHTKLAFRRERREPWDQATALVEERLGAIALHPRLEHRQLLGIRAHAGERHLMRPERPLDRDVT